MAEKDHNASVRGWDLPISRKFSVEVANFIRGKDLKVAKNLMEGVIAKKVAVPFGRYNRDLGHKPGRIGPGRYPVKVAQTVLRMLHSAEMNASEKGLDIEALYVSKVIANKGTGTMRASRHRGREAKRCHIEIVLQEREKKKKTTMKKKKEE